MKPIKYSALFANTRAARRWLRSMALALALSAFFVTLGLRAELSQSDWASWVQAVGSVGALLAVAATLREQRRLAFDLEQQRQADITAMLLLPHVFQISECSRLITKTLRLARQWTDEAKEFRANRASLTRPMLDWLDLFDSIQLPLEEARFAQKYFVIFSRNALAEDQSQLDGYADAALKHVTPLLEFARVPMPWKARSWQ